MTISMRGSPQGQGSGDGSPDQTQATGQPPVQNPLQQTAQPQQPPVSQSPTTTQQPSTSQDQQTPQEQPQSKHDDAGDVDEITTELTDDQEPDFPHNELAKLEDMINRPRWVVPVLPKGELEMLLDASIDLCKKGLDVRSEACQRFFRDGLTTSFTKILTDEAVSGWKFEIHRCIMRNTERLVELCVTKLSQDWMPLLDLLAMALNPLSKFHIYNGTRPSESVPVGSQISDDELFARPPDARTPK
ncbi:ubiquitin carboxyl-terminal hydrolase 9X-like, partial [Saccoglossus kowalevskii]|uniref:Probable ubiquitin carboxyl-terminal hydrolase FAF-X-like n=1 Tax=Saccoglossus kowalevskii TaxID=10224 RepID=A0ABM0MLI7_SACKO